jgi:predicted nucleic acid-binding protein
MPVNDSWIAATPIAHDLAIVTRDHDFDKVEEVRVIRL